MCLFEYNKKCICVIVISKRTTYVVNVGKYHTIPYSILYFMYVCMYFKILNYLHLNF